MARVDGDAGRLEGGGEAAESLKLPNGGPPGLSRLRSSWARLAVTVVDDTSRDPVAAVNRAAARGDGDHLLLAGPDVAPADGAVDELLALAMRFPRAGLYGLDARGGRRRAEVRPVPILTGGVYLVDRALWHRLGGLDERYALRGAAVDLCRRARRLGARPMVTAGGHGGLCQPPAAQAV